MNAAANLNWLVGRFVQQVAAVRQAVVVSSDGLPLAVSDGVDRESAGRLVAAGQRQLEVELVQAVSAFDVAQPQVLH